jgi:hypothetical protein
MPIVHYFLRDNKVGETSWKKIVCTLNNTIYYLHIAFSVVW